MSIESDYFNKVTHEVESLGATMAITKSVIKARVKIAEPPSVASEFANLYYWIETQVDTSGGRFFEKLDMHVHGDYVYCTLTLGWLHGKEDALLFEAAGIPVYKGDQPQKKLPKPKPVIEIDYDKNKKG